MKPKCNLFPLTSSVASIDVRSLSYIDKVSELVIRYKSGIEILHPLHRSAEPLNALICSSISAYACAGIHETSADLDAKPYSDYNNRFGFIEAFFKSSHDFVVQVGLSYEFALKPATSLEMVSVLLSTFVTLSSRTTVVANSVITVIRVTAPNIISHTAPFIRLLALTY